MAKALWRAARRDASEAEVVQALRRCGVSVYRLDQPVDLLLGFRGRTFLAEVKTGKKGYGKKLNESQRAFALSWRGAPVLVLREAADALAFVNGAASGGKA